MGLSTEDQENLLRELEQVKDEHFLPKCQQMRRHLLNNKQGCCAHCGHSKYVKFGIDKGAQRYKCKSCNRSFTEYTGTWMAGIHKKDKIDDYLQLMAKEQSLDKIKEKLHINKKTAFDWRHKVLSSFDDNDTDSFTGITESDETFFLHSEKGMDVNDRKPRKRGGSSSKKGVNNDHIAVIVTQDRKRHMELTVATTGRIKKKDIANSIGHRVTAQTILCTDSHVSYKGFAIDNNLEHHPLRADMKQRVKQGLYHIQHVNSTHNRVKKWLDNKFWGVSTKYLQQYLNWFKLKQTLKTSRNFLNEFAQRSVEDIQAYAKYKAIPDKYELLISTQC